MHGLGARSVLAALVAALACLGAGLASAQSVRPQETLATRPATREQLQAQPAQPAPTPPASGTAPVQVVVPANVEWVRTGQDVRRGGRLQINAGEGRWSVTGQSAATVARVEIYTNADGFAGRTAVTSLAPGANVGALIGKIGPNGRAFLVGSRYDATAAADGALFLAINDAAGAFADNAGRMPVSIAVTAPPPPPPTREPTPGATQPPTREPTPAPETPAPPTTQEPTPAPEAPAASPTEPPPVGEAPVVTPAAPVAPAMPSWLPVLAVVAGVLVLIALLGAAMGRRPPSQERRSGAGAQITTRIVSDGRADQQLTLNARGGRRTS